MKKIFYISYYAPPSDTEKRNAVLSAVNKMNYICESLEQNGCEVEIVSASQALEKRFCKARSEKITEGTTLKLFSSLPNVNKIVSLVNRAYIKSQMFFHMLKNTKRDSTVIVYHSLGYMSLVKLLKKLKGFRLVIEAEEVYGDVIGNAKAREKEYEFFKIADSFIFPTELLSEKVNTEKKPEAVIYGTYHIAKDMPKLFTDGKIHCVYAGVLEPRKGADTAISAAEYLTGDYHIHIIGFGRDEYIDRINKLISDVSEKTECTVTFDGKKSGDEYLQFLQSCQIGFVTQNSEAAYNGTSFPSKTLSYLSNGLKVVSVRIKAIETSKVADLIYFYDGDDPKDVANAVKSINSTDDYDSRQEVEKLGYEFEKEILDLTGE